MVSRDKAGHELHLQAFIRNEPIPEIMPKQRVTAVEQRADNKPTNEGENGADQRVTTPLANNPTAPRVLQTTSRTYQQCTQQNTPGALLKIVRAIRTLPEVAQAHIIPPLDEPNIAIKPTQQRVQVKVTQLLTTTTPRRSIRLRQHTKVNVQVLNARMISQ